MLGVVGVLHRPLLVDSLPHIARAVTATEEKRGTGLDHTLRFVHMILLNLYTGFMTGSVVAYFIYISPSPPIIVGGMFTFTYQMVWFWSENVHN